MTVLPSARPPATVATAGSYLLVSRAGGVFPVGRTGLWGSTVDAEDPAVGVVAGRRGHVVVRSSGSLDRAGPHAPELVHLGTGLGPVLVVRRLATGWWALHPGLARHLGSGRQVTVGADAVDLAGAADPVGVDRQGRLVGPDGAVLDDPGPLDDDLLGVVTTGDGGGWWLVTTVGTVIARGQATPFEPIAIGAYPHPLVAVGPSGGGDGFVVATADGRVHARGTTYPGGLPRRPHSGPIVAISPVPAGD